MRLTILLLCLLAFAFRADKPAYRLYTPALKTTTYAKLLRQAAEADVVLFGELHNNPICHWLEFQLAKDLQAAKKATLCWVPKCLKPITRLALSDYVQGKTTSKELATQARLWPNFDTDYKPIADFAREQHIPFVATNVPRRYARLVSRQGLVRSRHGFCRRQTPNGPIAHNRRPDATRLQSHDGDDGRNRWQIGG